MPFENITLHLQKITLHFENRIDPRQLILFAPDFIQMHTRKHKKPFQKDLCQGILCFISANFMKVAGSVIK